MSFEGTTGVDWARGWGCSGGSLTVNNPYRVTGGGGELRFVVCTHGYRRRKAWGGGEGGGGFLSFAFHI